MFARLCLLLSYIFLTSHTLCDSASEAKPEALALLQADRIPLQDVVRIYRLRDTSGKLC
ncbi:hypothetical protein [Gloeocapsopsis sp. IPPAS B-1203]|uniref:hypothetical protein n=1 Tax=Gloeocapsopsis sp. IPPAS B-1203 TaxID=2049454 RepID=UPI0025A1D72D|nr:hypothetical protein [Gloeocapsopsis sp. IPPAS B-1203]